MSYDIAEELYNYYTNVEAKQVTNNTVKIKGFMVVGDDASLTIKQVGNMVMEIENPFALVIAMNEDAKLRKLKTLDDFDQFIESYPYDDEELIADAIEQVNLVQQSTNLFEYSTVKVTDKCNVLISQLNDIYATVTIDSQTDKQSDVTNDTQTEQVTDAVEQVSDPTDDPIDEPVGEPLTDPETDPIDDTASDDPIDDTASDDPINNMLSNIDYTPADAISSESNEQVSTNSWCLML